MLTADKSPGAGTSVKSLLKTRHFHASPSRPFAGYKWEMYSQGNLQTLAWASFVYRVTAASAVKLSIWPRCSVGLGSSLSPFPLTPLPPLMSGEFLQIYMRCNDDLGSIQVILTELS